MGDIMKRSVAILLLVGGAFAVSGFAYSYWHQTSPIVFYDGHTHGPDGHAIGAPQHSGGLDSLGCHNASVPYHCHR